jgi:hypothetical protein
MNVARTCSLLAVLLAACADGRDDSLAAASSIIVDVAPPSASIGYRQSIQLNASVTGTALAAVSWTTDCGSITQAGLYTAPDTDTVCQVVARSEADTARSAAATVTVTASPPPVPAPPTGGWGAKCAAEPMRTTGTTYYACDCQGGAAAGCLAGNDANPGTSKTAPVKTMARIAQLWRGMRAGDTLALCRGGKFAVDQSTSDSSTAWRNTSCTGQNTCLMRDYAPSWGNGNEGQPVIFPDSNRTAFRLFGGGGYRFINLTIAHPAAGGVAARGSNGFIVNGDVNDLEVCNVTFDGLDFGAITDAHGKDAQGLYGTCGYRHHFRGNRFTNLCDDALLFQSHESDIDGNYFYNVGHDTCNNYYHFQNAGGGMTHTFYLASGCDSQNVRFINNEVRRSTVYNGVCAGAPVVTGGQTTGAVFENNYIEGTLTPGSNCGAIFGGNTVSNANYHGPRNLIVRRNRIKLWGDNAAIGFSAARNALIEDNVIETYGPIGSMGDYGGIIALPHYAESKMGPGSDLTTGGTIRNNTVFVYNPNDASPGNVSSQGWTFGNSAISVGRYTGGGFNVVGNAVYVRNGTMGGCFSTADKARIAVMNNNVCAAGPSGAFSSWMTAGSGYSLANWRTFSGFDAASSASDPQFVNATPSALPPAVPVLDLTPAVSSPLIAAGSAATNCTVGGVANQPCASPVGIGTVTWSATDTAKTRAAPGTGACVR